MLKGYLPSVCRAAAALVLVAGSAFALGAPPSDGGVVAPPRDCGPSDPDPLHGGLPYFDARLDADGRPIAAVNAAIEAAGVRTRGVRDLDEAALRKLVATVKIQDSPLLGTPAVVLSTDEFLTGVSPSKPREVVRQFLMSYPGLFQIDPAELDSARVDREAVTEHNGVTSFTFQQQIGGVDLYDAELRANVMPDGRLINIGVRMLPRPAGDFKVAPARLTDLDAIRIAAENCGVAYTRVIEPDGAAQGPSQKRAWKHSPDFMQGEAVRTELVYFPLTRDDIRTAWNVEVPVRGVGHIYDVIIDAQTGQMLRRQDRLVWDATPMTFRVFNSDGVAPGSPGRNTPDGFQFPEVPRTLLTYGATDVTAESPQGWFNTGSNITTGNNVNAYLDVNNDNAPDAGSQPDGGATRTFDFNYDSTLAPQSYQPFVVTELFWRGNWYHDRLYDLGFTEGFKNFQVNNLGHGGTGNDAVQAEAQDGSGTNNANFATSGADGSSARCQMYIFTGPTPDRDGALDGDIVYHEFTHGTSTRLHGGISGTQGGGMGEGWSDYYGISLLAESTDNPDAVYCTGGYTTLQLAAGFTNNYYFGIRRYPYCTDLTKSPLTYKDIDVLNAHTGVPKSPVIGGAANEVHNIGEVWCATLLEGRANLWHTYGFAGNQRMLQLVTDGMKLSLSTTSDFLHERDAILQADLADYSNVDRCDLWRAFAKRGSGSSATTPTGGNTAGIVEAFDLPDRANFAFPDGLPSTLTPGAAFTFHVTATPVGSATIVPNSGMVFVSRNGGAFTQAAMTETTLGHYTATLPASLCFDSLQYYFSVGVNSCGSVSSNFSPSTAPAASNTASVAANETQLYSDGFETANTGWTVTAGSPAATTGLWARMTPQQTAGTGGVIAQPGAAHGGTACWVTDGNAGASVGANDVDGGQTILTSASYNLAGQQDARITYWRWYSNTQGSNPGTNTFLVDVSTDGGGTWTRAETVGPGGAQANGGWFQASWTLSSLGLSPTSNVKLRFTAQDLTAAVVEALIDDLAIYSRSCTNPPTCDSADFNCDGDVGTDADIEAFFACIAGNCPAAPCTNSADFNHDGDTGTDADIEAFFRVLAGGSC